MPEASEGWSEHWKFVSEATAQGAQSWSAKVRNRQDGRIAFVKTCVESASGDRRRRMQREAQILSEMDGTPGIPRFYEASADDRPYIVTEFIDGKRLNEAMTAGEILAADAVSVALALCDVVEALHDRGIYHRDIKPDNLMVSGTPGAFVVHLVDYGSAYYDDNGFATDVGLELGNRFIRLPEFSSGIDSKRKPQSDLTMIVAVFFYLLVGIKPSVPQDETGAHPHQWPEAKEKLSSTDLHTDRLNRLFDTAFQLDISRRFQSIAELRTSLRSTLEQRVSAGADMSIDDIRERLFTPTEATRQEARQERAVVLRSIQQVVSAFAQQFNGTVTMLQSGWQDHPRRQATRNDLGLVLSRDERHKFAVRVKAITVGVETVVRLSSDNAETGTLRVPRSGLDAAHVDNVQKYFQSGLAALIKESELGDDEMRRLTHEEAKTVAFEMLTAMSQSLSYYLHMPARNKLEFAKQHDKVTVGDDGRYFSAENYMTARALNANGSIKFTYRARVEIPPSPGERDLECCQEIVMEGKRHNRPETVALRVIRSGEDEVEPMRVSVETLDAPVDELLAALS